MSEAFNSLLACLASDLNLPEIPSQDGMALIVIDDFEVCLHHLPSDQVLIYTVAAPLPEEGRNELMAELLSANTLFLETQGFTLAARPDTGVLLQGCLPMAVLHSGNISQWLENFLNVAEHWQARCLEAATPAIPASSGGEGDIDALTMMDMLRI